MWLRVPSAIACGHPALTKHLFLMSRNSRLSGLDMYKKKECSSFPFEYTRMPKTSPGKLFLSLSTCQSVPDGHSCLQHTTKQRFTRFCDVSRNYPAYKNGHYRSTRLGKFDLKEDTFPFQVLSSSHDGSSWTLTFSGIETHNIFKLYFWKKRGHHRSISLSL